MKIFAILIQLLIVSTSYSQEKVNSCLEEGIRLFSGQKYKSAAEVLEKVEKRTGKIRKLIFILPDPSRELTVFSQG